MKNLARNTHHADKVENGPKASDRRRLTICLHPDCRRRVMAMPDGAPTAAHCQTSWLLRPSTISTTMVPSL